MIFPGRWGSVCAAILAVLLCPCRVFAVDKLLIVNGTDMTMKAGQTEPFVGYILVGNNGKIKAIKPEIDALRTKARFFIAPSLEAAILTQAKE